MTDDISVQDGSLDSLEILAATVTDEFMERINHGERPEIEEYASRYPQIADVLRDVLPALQVMRSPDTAQPGPNSSLSFEQTGTLGDFRIIREIGRGGMGIVYEAMQISLNRPVALKVLPFAAALDTKRLQRFQHEAEAAAQLHHSNIVPVYSVGCERGVYYYAMQSIQGQSLAEVIQELRILCERELKDSDRASHVSLSETASLVVNGRKSSVLSQARDREQVESTEPERASRSDSNSDTKSQAYAAISTEQSTRTPSFIRSVVRLVTQAADAIEHAHAVGIIHRDIKPANLLVDTRANLWVTDFGLARYRTSVDLTMSGDLLGTLRYMSPEQALGKRGIVDHRADIYSLGATLYELLTLEPALSGSDREELLRQIAFEEPVLPRRLNPSIPSDLETIILKAMAKEPQDRYLLAQDFADDLRRFQDDRPILAKRPSLLERATKWARRHRHIVVSAIVLMLLTLAGLATSTVLVAKQQAETKTAYVAEAQQRALAEQNFQQARRMLDFFIQFTEEELAIRPDTEDLRRKLLEVGLNYYQDFILQSRNNPPLQAEISESHVRVARILNEIGSKPDAFAAFQRAFAFQGQLVRDHPEIREFRDGLYSLYRELVVEPGQNNLRRALNPTVQDDLQLSQVQIEQLRVLDAVLKDSRADFYRFCKMNREERKRQFAGHLSASNQSLAKILSTPQMDRLGQISVQLQRTRAFNDPIVQDALEITDQQTREIVAIREEVTQSWRGFPRRSNRDQERENQIKLWANALDRITLEVLSRKQRLKWKDMTGTLFDRSRYYQHRNQHRYRQRSSGSSSR